MDSAAIAATEPAPLTVAPNCAHRTPEHTGGGCKRARTTEPMVPALNVPVQATSIVVENTVEMPWAAAVPCNQTPAGAVAKEAHAERRRVRAGAVRLVQVYVVDASVRHKLERHRSAHVRPRPPLQDMGQTCGPRARETPPVNRELYVVPPHTTDGLPEI